MLRSHALLFTSLLLTPIVVSAQNSDDKIEKCDKPIGYIAVIEPQNEVLLGLQRYKLGSPTTLIRSMVQRTNCFTVVDRGSGMRTMMQERELASAGQLQEDSNVGAGQMKAADFALMPAVTFSEPNAGGRSFGLGGLIPGGALLGGLKVKFKEAETSMAITDVRSSVQVASAEGKASKSDMSLGAIGWLGGAVGGAGGWSNTNEGKVVAMSFQDNLNNMVIELKKHPEIKPSAVVAPTVTYREGDVVRPKIDNVKLYADANDASKVVGTVAKTDELVYLGNEKDGYLHVQGGAGDGWIKKVLVGKSKGGMQETSQSSAGTAGAEAFIGEWEGTIQSGGVAGLVGAQQVLHVSLTAGASTGANLTANCTGAVVFIGAAENHRFYRWDAIGGRCSNGVVLELISGTTGRLDMRVHPPGAATNGTDQNIIAIGALLKR